MDENNNYKFKIRAKTLQKRLKSKKNTSNDIINELQNTTPSNDSTGPTKRKYIFNHHPNKRHRTNVTTNHSNNELPDLYNKTETSNSEEIRISKTSIRLNTTEPSSSTPKSLNNSHFTKFARICSKMNSAN